MGIKFSLMFIICQKRIILCQSGLEELLLRSLQKFLFDKMKVALFQLCESFPLRLGQGALPQWRYLSLKGFSGFQNVLIISQHLAGFDLRVQKEKNVLFWNNFYDPQREQYYLSNVIKLGVK